jgi:hypothetical protein
LPICPLSNGHLTWTLRTKQRVPMRFDTDYSILSKKWEFVTWYQFNFVDNRDSGPANLAVWWWRAVCCGNVSLFRLTECGHRSHLFFRRFEWSKASSCSSLVSAERTKLTWLSSDNCLKFIWAGGCGTGFQYLTGEIRNYSSPIAESVHSEALYLPMLMCCLESPSHHQCRSCFGRRADSLAQSMAQSHYLLPIEWMVGAGCACDIRTSIIQLSSVACGV